MQRKRSRSTTVVYSKPNPSAGKLRPNRPILKIGRNGLSILEAESITPENVGWKAYGLTRLPSMWVPTFFVIDGTAMECADYNLQNWVQDALGKAVFSSEFVMVRSSGTAETMINRGQLASYKCEPELIVGTIRRLSSEFTGQLTGVIHWIVQTHFPPVMKGHLSNERHLSYEHRDWVAEIEGQGERQGYTSNIGIRPWRDGSDLTDLDLRCGSESQITLCLRRVAKWATASRFRLHFEWVWNGARIWMVQADVAEAEPGFDLKSLKPNDIPVITTVRSLHFNFCLSCLSI